MGRLLDRIDIHIEVPRVDYEKLSEHRMLETSESIRARVQAARNIQLARFANVESLNIVANADIRFGEIRRFCKLQDEGQSDDCGDDTAQFVNACLSSHPEISADDCGLGRGVALWRVGYELLRSCYVNLLIALNLVKIRQGFLVFMHETYVINL